jgi:hypothetical protein
MLLPTGRQVEKFMDISRDKPTGSDGGPYIWLRYTTQFTTGGRTHTVEMGVPVPVGASAEMREQLIREAEIGMEQLSRRVEGRVSQMLQRNARPEASPMRPAQVPLPDAGNRSTTGTPVTGTTRSTAPASSPGSPAQPPAQQGPQALPLHERQAPPPVRQSVAANMPATFGIQGDANSNMNLGQFIRTIKNVWGLSPKEAMDLLNVKTLNGMNYREVLRELQPLVEKDGKSASTPAKNAPAPGQPKTTGPGVPASSAPPAGAARNAQANATSGKASGGEIKHTPAAPQPPIPIKPAPQAPPARSAPATLPGPANIPVIPIRDEMVRDSSRVYKFDEEEEGEDEVELAKEKDEDEENRAIARIKLDELKEVRGGSSLASPGRLTVLQNVLNSQISEPQLQRLIQSVWGATTVKKLKVDQVEALISWAKEDYFVDEVEAVLALLDEEESYARSDW